MIQITKPYLPPYERYEKYLKKIWESQWLTNNGPLLNELELKLKDQEGIGHLLVVGNGTIALQLAIKGLELSGEIITTPFSFVSTTSSIVWEGCEPVFVDIDKETLNIDTNKIEDKISGNTSAILVTHVYGNPCDIETIQRIADKHDLKVIYDAAHCFGVHYKERSIFEYGDISICSFHATKVFHTVEGGMLVTRNSDLLKKLAYMRNFGFESYYEFAELGINAKNSEFHAAMGLSILPDIGKIASKRQELCAYYDSKLEKLNVRKPTWNKYSNFNAAYYPLVFESSQLRADCQEALENAKIYPRRYFYPPLSSSLPYLNETDFQVTESVSQRVLCLPLYYDLTKEQIDMIARLLLRTQNNY